MKRTLSLLTDDFTAKRQSRLLLDALLYNSESEEETRVLVDFSIIELEQKSQLEAVNEFNITNNQFHYQLPLPIDAEAMPAEEEKIFYAIIKGTDPNISNNILGFLHLKKEEIVQLFIEDSKREQGIGRDLVQTCKKYLTNSQKYIVHTYSAQSAVGFWDKMNFEQLENNIQKFYHFLQPKIVHKIVSGKKINLEFNIEFTSKKDRNTIPATVNKSGIYFQEPITCVEFAKTPRVNIFHLDKIIYSEKTNTDIAQRYMLTQGPAIIIKNIPRIEGDESGATAKMIDSLLDAHKKKVKMRPAANLVSSKKLVPAEANNAAEVTPTPKITNPAP